VYLCGGIEAGSAPLGVVALDLDFLDLDFLDLDSRALAFTGVPGGGNH